MLRSQGDRLTHPSPRERVVAVLPVWVSGASLGGATAICQSCNRQLLMESLGAAFLGHFAAVSQPFFNGIDGDYHQRN